MKTVFVIYKTDVHHSYNSRDLVAISDTFPNAIDMCKLQSRKENETLEADDLYNLHHIKQTQGYAGEGELVIEEIKTNCLL